MLATLIQRFKEPSSWAAITAGLTGLGFHLDPDVWQSIAYIGAGLAGGLAFFLSEKK